MLRCLFLCISNFELWECSKMAKQTCYYLSTQWLLSCKFQLINKSLKFLSPFLLPFKVGISQTNLFIIGMGTIIPVFLSFCPATFCSFSVLLIGDSLCCLNVLECFNLVYYVKIKFFSLVGKTDSRSLNYTYLNNFNILNKALK